MPIPALTTDIGAANANTYVSLAEANDYFDARLDSEAWNNADSDDRARALLKAAWRLNRFNWLGSRVTTAQRLAWPRSGVAKRDSINVCTYAWAGSSYSGQAYGEQYRTDEIPDLIKEAQCEFAFAFLEGFNDGEDDRVEELADDKFRVKFRDDRPAGALPAEVTRLIEGLHQGNRLVRA